MDQGIYIFEDPEDFISFIESLQEAYNKSHDSTSANGVETDVK